MKIVSTAMKIVSQIYRKIPIIRELYQISRLLTRLLEKNNIILNRLIASETIKLIDFELRNNPRYTDPQRLPSYHSQVCSQNGEDGIIHEIFLRIGTKNRDFVEIGVGSGYENNTAFLLSQGWTGCWIDGSSKFLKSLENKPNILKQNRIRYLVEFVTAENINYLLQKLNVPKEFDLLSLDIDMNTYYVWQSIRDFSPRVVVIEYNSAIPPDIEWKVSYDSKSTWNKNQNFGASLKSLELLGHSMGYNLVGCDILGINAFFVRHDLADVKFLKPFTSENHYEPPRYPMMHKRTHNSTILDINS